MIKNKIFIVVTSFFFIVQFGILGVHYVATLLVAKKEVASDKYYDVFRNIEFEMTDSQVTDLFEPFSSSVFFQKYKIVHPEKDGFFYSYKRSYGPKYKSLVFWGDYEYLITVRYEIDFSRSGKVEGAKRITYGRGVIGRKIDSLRAASN